MLTHSNKAVTKIVVLKALIELMSILIFYASDYDVPMNKWGNAEFWFFPH